MMAIPTNVKISDMTSEVERPFLDDGEKLGKFRGLSDQSHSEHTLSL